MRRFLSSRCLETVSVSLTVVFVTACSVDPTIVHTSSGIVRGVSSGNVLEFKGIPYAAPPLGRLRWSGPQDVASWSGVRTADSFGQSCVGPQSAVGGNRTASGEGWDFIATPMRADTGEDCLYLNIWKPLDADNAPVMVFLSAVGDGSLSYWDGTNFARDGVVLVTFNQRMWTLGEFPHPALRTSQSANGAPVDFGKLDRLQVLRWIQENIHAFGGNPDNVTISGQSAGGRFVLDLLATPEATGLYHKAIVQSCCSWSPPISAQEAELLAVELVNFAGLDGSNITAAELLALEPDRLPFFVGAMGADLMSTVTNRGLMDVPLMIGGTDWDGSSLRRSTPEQFLDSVPQNVLGSYEEEARNMSTRELGYQVYTDEHVNAPVRWLAREIARRNAAPVYRYLFSYVVSLRQGQQGAAHTDDVMFVFDSWDHVIGADHKLTAADRNVTATVHACWVNFAKSGVPSCGTLSVWPQTTPESDVLVEFGSVTEVRENYRQDQYDSVESWILGSRPSNAEVDTLISGIRSLED